jgi:hypothetical protein
MKANQNVTFENKKNPQQNQLEKARLLLSSQKNGNLQNLMNGLFFKIVFKN